MKTLIVVSVASCLALGGCTGDQSAEKESKELRDSMTKGENFDINKVPPEHREKVKQMMGGGGGNPAAKGGQ